MNFKPFGKVKACFCRIRFVNYIVVVEYSKKIDFRSRQFRINGCLVDLDHCTNIFLCFYSKKEVKVGDLVEISTRTRLKSLRFRSITYNF